MNRTQHITKVEPIIEPSWLGLLNEEFQKEYFADLKQFLIAEKSTYEVYPPSSKIFNAFDQTPVSKVKVVILGQDPYHSPGQAHGLSFSVPPGVKQPPSLKNIFKELASDLNINNPENGDLTPWAQQGVLLLNATLTVRKSTAGSHQKKGWEIFTDAVIKRLSDTQEHIVFILWGNFARSKAVLIDEQKHFILVAPHPSPFSAYTGFFGCRHFSKTNEYLKQRGLDPIDWNLA